MAKHNVRSQKNNLPAALTIASPLAVLHPDRPLTPAAAAIVWRIAALLDESRVPSAPDNPVWLEVSARKLRGPAAQARNRWLRECLDRLTGVKLGGEYRGRPWGAVLVSEWKLDPRRGGSVSLLIPPAAVMALRNPENFAKVEEAAIHRLSGPARRLYVALADRKRQGRRWQEYDIDRLREALGVPGLYHRWCDLRHRVLLPALAEIEAFGTVSLTMTLLKTGRRVTGVRLAWRWKTLDEIRVTAEETAKAHPYAEQPAVPTAPPLLAETREDRERNERAWFENQPSERRDRLEESVPDPGEPPPELTEGFSAELLSVVVSGWKEIRMAESRSALIRQAYEKAHPDDPPFSDLEPAA